MLKLVEAVCTESAYTLNHNQMIYNTCEQNINF